MNPGEPYARLDQGNRGYHCAVTSSLAEVVNLMAKCRSQGELSSEKVSSAGDVLEKITLDTSMIMDMTTTIAAAIEQQRAGTSEVNEHVVMIRDVANSTAKSSDQNATLSKEVSAQTEALHRSVVQFKVC